MTTNTPTERLDEEARILGFADHAHRLSYEEKMLGTLQERLASGGYLGFDKTNALLAEANEKIATLLAELAQARAEVGRLEGVIEKTLAYKGPKWPDEMTKMEKLAHLYKGDINWRPE